MFEWCTSSYVVEIEKYMKEKESQYRFCFDSPQLRYRSKLIEWLRYISEKFKLCTVTLHLAVNLLDKFMDNHNIPIQKLCPVGFGCLLVAAKFEERECRVPNLNELPPVPRSSPFLKLWSASRNELQSPNRSRDLARLELLLLTWFDWEVGHPTAAHFAEYYSLYSVVNGDTNPCGTPHRHLQDLVLASLKHFLDHSLSEVALLAFKASKVAASCLLAARMEHRISPNWPKHLVVVTGYAYSDLVICLNILLMSEIKSVSRKRKHDESLDQGYESASPEMSARKRRFL